MQQNVAFGHWPSPISAASVAGSALRFGRVQVSGGAVYWSEGRPLEQGRTPIMRWAPGGGVSELLPLPFSARSRVHEYGGGEFVVAGDALYFINDADQDIYALALTEGAASIKRLTTIAATRFADPKWDRLRGRLIAVGETHDGAPLPRNELWQIPTAVAEKAPAPVLCGRDFYASPCISPSGNRLAFLAWDLPEMPWDAARLYVVDIAADGSFGEPHHVAGGDGFACFQPEWNADDTLYFVSDATGQGNLYRYRPHAGRAEQITDLDGDLSLPLWTFNAASYALLTNDQAFLSFVARGETKFASLDLETGAINLREMGLTAFSSVSGEAGQVALAGLSDDTPLCVFRSEARAVSMPEIVRRSSAADIEQGFVARPRRLVIPTERGEVFGLFYSPANPSVEASSAAARKPPLIISLHGGPTGAAGRGLKPRTLFFTSRGFSWLDLDYSGSTGYGRAYRDRLKGNWGVADVQDTIAAARFCGEERLVDGSAIFVTGGSAGGYTVLMAIATSTVFRGAASYYGICDLVALQQTTHKFEHGYQSTLLGGALEDHEAIYRQRSALSHIDTMETPLILFQGTEDVVVPKDQSARIAEALRSKGVTVDYHEFAGEGHGFRQSTTIETCLERELAFYRALMEAEGA